MEFAMEPRMNVMMRFASMNHQNSLREARPLKTAYFFQKRRKASVKEHP